MSKKARKTTCAPVVPGMELRVCVSQPVREGPVVSGPDDVCKLLRRTIEADRESLYAIHLDASNKVVGVEEVAKGTLTSTVTTPREIFKSALLTNAAGIILAHNHPSGNPTPSADDLAITRQLITASKVVGVPLRDHIIVAQRGCTSLRTIWGEGQGFGHTRRRRSRRRR